MKKSFIIENGIEYSIEEYDNGNNNGNKYWILNNKLHRINGPAIEYSDGTKFWFLHGKYHRINGAAIEWTDGDKWWYLDDIKYTKRAYYLELLKRGLISKKEAFIELI